MIWVCNTHKEKKYIYIILLNTRHYCYLRGRKNTHASWPWRETLHLGPVNRKTDNGHYRRRTRVNRALFRLFAQILRNTVRKRCGSCGILTTLNRSLRNSIRSSFSMFADGRLVDRREDFQITWHAQRIRTVWHRRATVVENNGGCGVSVLLWFDGEEGDARPTVPHPLSRAHGRYRCRQCGQRYGRGGRYSDAASFSRQKRRGPRVYPARAHNDDTFKKQQRTASIATE